ncbi:MAG: hypothetical protein WC516_07165 [Patescibacteria group bacterium]|jgi:hypothetical protein
MSIPNVTCGADVIVASSSSPQTISLTASASGSPTSWRWDILSVAPGSMANVGVKGSFTDGVAFIQNPILEIDANIDGGYCIQCRATNSDGQSSPSIDKSNGQQLIIVQVGTSSPILELPPDYAYKWGETYINPNLRSLRTAIINNIDDKKVKVSIDDSMPNFLENKLLAGSNIALTTINPGTNEQIRISYTGGGGGGLSPIFQWNGTDVSEFIWEFGDSLSELNSSVVFDDIDGIGVIKTSIYLRLNNGQINTITANGDGSATIYSSLAEFRDIDIEKLVTISGSNNPDNDGSFEVLASSYEYITYSNANAITENPISAIWNLTFGTSVIDFGIVITPVSLTAGDKYMITSDIFFVTDPTSGPTSVFLASRLSYSFLGGAFDVKGYALSYNGLNGVNSVQIDNIGSGIVDLNSPISVSWSTAGSGSRLMHASTSGSEQPIIYENGPDFRFVQAISVPNISGLPAILISSIAEGATVSFFNLRVFEITNPATVSTGRWY